MPKTFTEDQLETVTIGEYKYLVQKTPILEHYPQLVAEQLVDGSWWIMQVDNIHDIDQENQRLVVATDNPTFSWSERIPDVPTIKEYYLDQAHHRFEAANYHSEFHMVAEAVEYMSEEKAIEYLKQVQTP